MWRRQGRLGWVGLGPTLELAGILSHRFGELAQQWGEASIRERQEGLALPGKEELSKALWLGGPGLRPIWGLGA